MGAYLVKRHRVDLNPEQQQLPRIESLRFRAVTPAENRVDLGFLFGFEPLTESFHLLGGFLLDAFDERVVFGVKLLLLLDEQPLE